MKVVTFSGKDKTRLVPANEWLVPANERLSHYKKGRKRVAPALGGNMVFY
jgi:hypothetical protein